MKHIGHALGGVVDIALEIHQGRPLLQHPVPVALGHRVGHGLHIGVTLSDVHIVPDTDDIGHEGDHIGGLPHGLAVGDLALALVQVLDLQAQQVAGAGEGEAGQIPQRVRHGKHPGDLLVRLVPSEEKVVFV